MITLNQLAGNDNELIWVIMIDLNGTLYRFLYGSNENITLSGNTFYSGVIEKDSLSYSPRTLNISNGGTIGSVAALNFNISQRKGFSLNDIAPATNKPCLTSSSVYFGFFWKGATLDSEITWKERFVVEDVKADVEGLSLFCVEAAELELIKLPYYVTQKDYDDGISYAPYVPADSLGMAIPLLYGEWDIFEPEYDNVKLAPTITLDTNRQIFKIASHQCGYRTEQSTKLYKHYDENNAYLVATPNDPTIINSGKGFSIEMSLDYTFGEMILRCDLPGASLDNVQAAVEDHKQIATITNTQAIILSLKHLSRQSNLWEIYPTPGDNSKIQLLVKWSCEYNLSVLLTIAIRNANSTMWNLDDCYKITENYTYPTGRVAEIGFSNYTGWDSEAGKLKNNDVLPWQIDELTDLNYYIKNDTSGATFPINIEYAVLKITSIYVHRLIDAR